MTGRLDRLAGDARRLLRQHWALVLLLLGGLVLRALVMLAYRPAFWYQGDSQSYLVLAYRMEPGTIRPYGYSLFLDLFLAFHSVALITAVQHLMGLAVAVAAYALLRRRDVSRLISALAVAPLVFDARTVVLEHFLLAETLFTALLTIGMVALAWNRTPGWLGTLVAAGVFSWAAVTRTIGLVALAVPLLYLLLRRVSWRRTGVFVAVVGTVLGGYVFWYHHVHGQYSFGTFGSRFLWARTTSFVNCERAGFTPQERQLCPPHPIEYRWPPDTYLWSWLTPEQKRPEYDELFARFARKAVLAQPGDYATTVARDTWTLIRPGPYPGEKARCVADMWTFPAAAPQGCQPYLAPADPATKRYAGLVSERDRNPLTGPLHRYSGLATVPGAALAALCFLLALALACYRPRSSPWREHLDPLAWTGLAFGMIVASIATSAIDPRYGLPSMPLAVVGAALAWRRFRVVRQYGRRDDDRPVPAGSGGTGPSEPVAAAVGPPSRV
ncbi:hypothetical protein AB0J86_30890 [Micromonospora sp. NPDC049559]|uniref:hypothetical protein n=1 Tax=Micromonospora sp. NPDC049559 TaxID=3155923 RepID=UPI0034341455